MVEWENMAAADAVACSAGNCVDDLLVLRAERDGLESAERRDHRKGRGGCRTGLCLPDRTRAADALRRRAVRGSQVRTLQRICAPGLPAAAALRQLCPAARRPCGLALRNGVRRDGRAAPVGSSRRDPPCGRTSAWTVPASLQACCLPRAYSP